MSHSFFAFLMVLWRGIHLRITGSSALRDTAALGSGTLLSQAVLFLGAPMFLRLYGPHDFGLYYFTYSLITLIATIGTWKIERLVVVVPSNVTAVRLLSALISIAACAAVVLWVLIFLMEAIGGRLLTGSSVELKLVGPAPLAMFILIAMTGTRFYSIREGRFKLISIAQISRSMVFVVGSIVTAFFWSGLGKNGALVMIAWQIAADGCALLIQLWGNGEKVNLLVIRPRIRRSLNVLKMHRKTVTALAVSQIICSIHQQIPISTVTVAFGAVPAGWYSLASSFVYKPYAIVGAAISDVVNQRLSRLHAEHRPFSDLLLRITLGMAVIGAAPFMIIGVAGPFLLRVIVGPQWLEASQSVSVLALASYFQFVSMPAGNVAFIVQARRYIILWHALRLASLAILGAVAVSGLISYTVWLISAAVSDSFLYLFDSIMAFTFAHVADRRHSGRK